jgi:hypothetical protein
MSAEALGIIQPRKRMGVRRDGRVAPARAREAEWAFEFG